MAGPLPPGQIETRRFPVVGERSPSGELDHMSSWSLVVEGEVRSPMVIGLAEFLGRAHADITFDIHCVTSWTRFDSWFTGMPLAELLGETGPTASARFVSFEAYSERGHHTSLPLDVAVADTWLVHSFQGDPLTIDHGGPVRAVTPGRYFYKSLKWLRRIVVLEEDRPGWWETNSSYHNNGQPWSGAERFTTGSMRPGQLERFLVADGYDKYRGRVMLGLDLRTWVPGHRDLHNLQLKNCDLRSVDLEDVDLRHSNLSLSDLRGARLRNANLSGSDLEGANFAGADLTGADLSNTALSATRFAEEGFAATLDGANFDGSWGLTESQEAYLSSVSQSWASAPEKRHGKV